MCTRNKSFESPVRIFPVFQLKRINRLKLIEKIEEIRKKGIKTKVKQVCFGHEIDEPGFR